MQVQTEGGALTQEAVPNEKIEKKYVEQKDHESALKDLHKYKSKVKEYESKLTSYETEKETKAQEDLKKQNMYKELADKLEKDLAEEKSKREKNEKMFLNTKKFESLRQAAIRAGIRKEAEDDLELLSLDDVQIEYTSTGKINVSGAEDYITLVKKTKPHWFSGDQVVVNAGGTNNTQQNDVPDDYKKIAAIKYTDPAKYRIQREAWHKKNKGV